MKQKQLKQISLAQYASALGITKQGAHKRLMARKHPGVRYFRLYGNSLVLTLTDDYTNYFKLK